MFLFLLLFLFNFFALANNSIPALNSAQFVAENLNITKIKSSIGPRISKEKKLFFDYGFKLIKSTETEAVLEDLNLDDRWQFKILVLEKSKDSTTICIEDKALNGGSYFSRTPYKLKFQDGLLEPISKERIKHPNCEQ